MSSKTKFNPDLLKLFFEDARDTLEEWERVCLKLTPQDGPDWIEPLLRCAHNFKGAAGLIGFESLYVKVHEIEDLLVRIKDTKLIPSPEVVSVLLGLEQVLNSWVERLKTDASFVADTSAIEAKMREVVESGAARTVAPARRRVDEPQPSFATRGETVRVSAHNLMS
ncbi:MAG: hypothetical protein HC902_05180 [Calothrix sp. SM1_5_4]|nr:hypothetical protein [Calothrix sp. SM1_5_4]